MKRFFSWKRGAETPKPAAPAAGADAVESGLLTGDPKEDARSLEVLLETIAAVTSSIDLDGVLRGIVEQSLQVTRAERAFVFLGELVDGLQVRMALDKDGNSLVGDTQYSRSVVRRCFEERQAVRSVVQSDDEARELGQSVYDLKLRAVMCAPMMARNRMVGAIYVDSRAMRREFSARDLALFDAISSQLAVAVENARLHADSLEKVRLQKDVEIARRIQHHLLPAVPAGLPGLDLALRYVAAEAASGDTYDFVPLRDGRLAIMVGDVTGHGVGAALLTHTAQAAMRSYLELIDDPSEVVTRLNHRLVAGVEAGNFMSLLLAVVDPQRRTLTYVNAGHPALLLVRPSGVTAMEKTGMVLGVVGDQKYAVSRAVALERGDLLFLHTDGVDEAMSPTREVFGDARLHALLQRLAGVPAERVLTEVELALREHAAGQPPVDDFTMIAARLS
jgi:serine phosphatase RsbU (regulator of sigma subunit)